LLLLTKRLQGELCTQKEERIENHLKLCPSCRVAYASAEEAMGQIDPGWSAKSLVGPRTELCAEKNRHVETEL
jgi:predicted anti-sigma-YlaC factor YlaD